MWAFLALLLLTNPLGQTPDTLLHVTVAEDKLELKVINISGAKRFFILDEIHPQNSIYELYNYTDKIGQVFPTIRIQLLDLEAYINLDSTKVIHGEVRTGPARQIEDADYLKSFKLLKPNSSRIFDIPYEDIKVRVKETSGHSYGKFVHNSDTLSLRGLMERIILDKGYLTFRLVYNYEPHEKKELTQKVKEQAQEAGLNRDDLSSSTFIQKAREFGINPNDIIKGTLYSNKFYIRDLDKIIK